MKKLILGACALLALATVSCGKCGDGSCSTPTNDSLSNAYGDYVGTVLGADFQHKENADAQKKEFLRGMQIVFGADEDQNTRMGMQVALQMLGEMSQLDEQGAHIDRAKAMAAFKRAFLADSINTMDAQSSLQLMQRLISEAREQAADDAAKKKAEAPEALENVKAGEKYVADLKAKDSSVKTAPSGLSYKIEDEGQGDKAKENSTVVVNYTGRHLNGDVFDSTDGRNPATFNLQGVVPGFREGIMLLGKTGRATLYIPGELAYGPNGQPAAGIGPNEMLVFDVEVLDIDPE